MLGDHSEGVHLFPFRTQKLSPLASMVLLLPGNGRVESRQAFFYLLRITKGYSYELKTNFSNIIDI